MPQKPRPSILGERILLARRREGLSQDELGKACGVTGHTIGQLERGAFRELRSDAVRKAAKALGVTTDYLLGMDLEEGELPEPVHQGVL